VENLLIPEVLDKVRKYLLCGNFGDPIYYPDLFKLLHRLKDKPVVFTNGSIHSSYWWHRLAGVVSEVFFCIDGISKTHEIYRGTDYDRVMSNMESFVAAGGKGIWYYIVFRHNEHQVDEAKRLAGKMGVRFQAVSSRVYTDTLQRPIDHEFTFTRRCRVDEPWELYIGADGRVSMCCHCAYRDDFENEKNLNDCSINEILNSSAFMQQLRLRKRMEYCQKCK
jgi:hypothetical protein